MNILRDIQSLSVFKQNASKIVKEIQETKEPVVLTVNGKAAVVVQDAESYQRLIDSIEYNQTVVVLRERMEDLKNSDEWPTAKEAFDGIRLKYGIKRG